MRKNNTILGMVFVLAVGLASCGGQKNDGQEKFRKGWTLTWEDNFDKGAGLAHWSKIPRTKQIMNKYMSNNDALYVLEDGLLVLRGVENVGENAEVPFLTGGITREGVKRNSVNRIEVRARMNPVTGAVHLLPCCLQILPKIFPLKLWNGMDMMSSFINRLLRNTPLPRECLITLLPAH